MKVVKLSKKGHFAWEEFVFHALSTVAEGDFYFLGVRIRLLTQCKILDVVSFLHCLQIIFSLKSPSPTLKIHMDLPS